MYVTVMNYTRRLYNTHTRAGLGQARGTLGPSAPMWSTVLLRFVVLEVTGVSGV